MPKYNFHTVKKENFCKSAVFSIFFYLLETLAKNASRIMKNAAAKAREKCEK